MDFGQGAWVVEDGKRRKTHLFRGVLSHSRKGYRLWTLRARYDTKRQTHAEGAQAWVGFRDDLAMRPDNMSPPDKVFKLQPFFLQSEVDLADVDPTSITLQKRAYRPLAPLNLRVAGDGVNPTYVLRTFF